MTSTNVVTPAYSECMKNTVFFFFVALQNNQTIIRTHTHKHTHTRNGKKMVKECLISVAVLEGRFSHLSKTGVPLSICLHLQDSGFSLDRLCGLPDSRR